MRRYISGGGLLERGRAVCAVAFAAALLGGPIFGVAGASGHGNGGHKAAPGSATGFQTGQLLGQAGAGMAHDGNGGWKHGGDGGGWQHGGDGGGWQHGGDGGGWQHGGADQTPAPQAAAPQAPVQAAPPARAPQVIPVAAPEHGPAGPAGGGPPPWAGHGDGGPHGFGGPNGPGGRHEAAPGNGGPNIGANAGGGPQIPSGRAGQGPPARAGHGRGGPPPWAHHGGGGPAAVSQPSASAPVHTSQRASTPAASRAPVVPVAPAPAPAPAPIAAPAPVAPPAPSTAAPTVITVTTGPSGGGKRKQSSLPTFDSTTSPLSGFTTLPARLFGAGGTLRLGSTAGGFGSLLNPGARTSTFGAGSYPGNAALGSTVTGSGSALGATSGRAAAGTTRHPSGKSSSGPSYIEVVPSFVNRFVNHIPLGVWLAIAASLALAVVGAGAAVAFRHKANRHAGRFAAVAAAALTDPLTGVLNRRGFTEAVERELARARRYHRPFVLAYVDVRGLKAVNDTEGHLAGDELLKGVAALLTDCARADDVVGRLGGDELGVLLAEQPADVATTVTQRIEEQVAHRRTALGLSAPWSLTIGTAAFPDDGHTFDELIRTADRRLYEQRGIDLR